MHFQWKTPFQEEVKATKNCCILETEKCTRIAVKIIQKIIRPAFQLVTEDPI